MNLKKAKRLRKAIGAFEGVRVAKVPSVYQELAHTRRRKTVRDYYGSAIGVLNTVTMIHDPATTRGVYRALKKASKR